MHSIILTVHNKDWLIEKVLEGIILNTRTPYELIIIIDGCTDNSEKVIYDTLISTPVDWKLLYLKMSDFHYLEIHHGFLLRLTWWSSLMQLESPTP